MNPRETCGRDTCEDTHAVVERRRYSKPMRLVAALIRKGNYVSITVRP